MLESRIAGVQEAGEVAVDAAGGVGPRGLEEGVVSDCNQMLATPSFFLIISFLFSFSLFSFSRREINRKE